MLQQLLLLAMKLYSGASTIDTSNSLNILQQEGPDIRYGQFSKAVDSNEYYGVGFKGIKSAKWDGN